MLSKNKYQEKADNATALAHKNINRSDNMFYKMIFGSTHREDRLNDSIDLLETAASNYKTAKDFDKYIDTLITKSKIEKELLDHKYIYTLISISEHYSKDEYLDESKSFYYYDLALEYCLENKTDSLYMVYDKIINLYEKLGKNNKVIEECEFILEKYKHLLSNMDAKKIFEKLGEHYFTLKKYDGAQMCFDECIKKISNKTYSNFLMEKFFYKAILASLANNDYIGSNKKFDKYCELSITFINSTIGKFIKQILLSIQTNDLTYFHSAIDKCYITFTVSETSTLEEIEKIYFYHALDNNTLDEEIDIT